MTSKSDQSAGANLSAAENEGIEALARFYEREDAHISTMQAAIEKISCFFGSSKYFVAAVLFIVLWIAVNTWGYWHGWRHIDAPPFSYLQGLTSANALLLTIAVLIRQNRTAELADHRAHLDLQVNLSTERKVSKLLALMHDRSDTGPVAQAAAGEVEELVKPADPESLLAAIKEQGQSR